MYYNAHKQVRPNQFEKSINIFFFKRKWVQSVSVRCRKVGYLGRKVSQNEFIPLSSFF